MKLPPPAIQPAASSTSHTAGSFLHQPYSRQLPPPHSSPDNIAHKIIKCIHSTMTQDRSVHLTKSQHKREREKIYTVGTSATVCRTVATIAKQHLARCMLLQMDDQRQTRSKKKSLIGFLELLYEIAHNNKSY